MTCQSLTRHRWRSNRRSGVVDMRIQSTSHVFGAVLFLSSAHVSDFALVPVGNTVRVKYSFYAVCITTDYCCFCLLLARNHRTSPTSSADRLPRVTSGCAGADASRLNARISEWCWRADASKLEYRQLTVVVNQLEARRKFLCGFSGSLRSWSAWSTGVSSVRIS